MLAEVQAVQAAATDGGCLPVAVLFSLLDARLSSASSFFNSESFKACLSSNVDSSCCILCCSVVINLL